MVRTSTATIMRELLCASSGKRFWRKTQLPKEVVPDWYPTGMRSGSTFRGYARNLEFYRDLYAKTKIFRKFFSLTQRFPFKKPMELIALCAKSRKDMLNISPAAKPYNTYKIKIYLTRKEQKKKFTNSRAICLPWNVIYQISP